MADTAPQSTLNQYAQIIERVFLTRYTPGATEVPFEREDVHRAAQDLGFRISNIGDILFTFRYRKPLPESINVCAPSGRSWIIQPAGRARYLFAATVLATINPNPALVETKVPDSTPGMIARYALSDEQALLARLRYNRLVDVFTGVTCYSLQNHLRTAVRGLGQIETDEVYVGVDRRGVHYVIPLQAKRGNDILGVVQFAQDIAMCRAKFPDLVCRPVAAQFMADDVIALFELEQTPTGIRILAEKHYRLAPADQVSAADLETYRRRPD